MLNHQGTLQIETERLKLRQFTLEDVDAMFNHWASDWDVCKYMRWHPHKDKNESQIIISKWMEAYKYKAFYQWAITKKHIDQPIGAIGVFVVSEIDLCGEIGYCLDKDFWGQGIMTEALNAVLNFAFNLIEFNRVEAYHTIKNPASGKVMEKSGMILEGFARQKYKSICGFQDSFMYAAIRDDFI